MIGTTIIAAIALLALGVLGMAIKVIFHKSHSFPETSPGDNQRIQQLGIRCPRQEDESQRNDACANCLAGNVSNHD